MDPRTLATLSLAALRRLAAERRVPGRARMTRDALVSALSDVAPKAPKTPKAPKRPKTPKRKGSPKARATRIVAPASAPVASEPAAPARLPREVEIRALAEGLPGPAREPSEAGTFLDRGAVLPDRYPGTRVRVMVRDPETLYVYWEVPPGTGGEAWEIASLDAEDRTLQAFRVGHGGTSGYLHVASVSVERVMLRPVQHGLPAEPWATVDLAAALPEPPLVQGPASWVDVPAAFPDREPPPRHPDPRRETTGPQRAARRPDGAPPAAPGETGPEATSSTLVRRRT